MAYSSLALVAIRKQIERLRDPRHLNDTENASLDSLLTLEELEEVERRRSEIYSFNEFMLWPEGVYERLEVSDADRWSLAALNSAIQIANLEYPGQVRRLASARERIAKKRAAGIRNPTVYADDAWLEWFHSWYGPSLIDKVRRAYERLTPRMRLSFEDKQVWTPEDYYPTQVESWENIVWPNHPNAHREALIEVLTEKLARVEAELRGS